MKFNKWTLGLAALGLVSFVSAEERSNPVLTALSTTTISGYVDTSAIWKFGDNQGAGGGARGFANQPAGTIPLRAFDGNGKQDGFNLNVVGLTIEKPMGDEQWASAYKADLLFGPDANSFVSGWNGVARNNSSDLGIKQAYVALKAPVGNGLVFKMGVFDSLHSCESFESYKNPNYSRSYGYGLMPLNHTGLLVSYKVAEFLSLDAGVVNSSNGGINEPVGRSGSTVSESEKAWLGRVTLTAPESTGFLSGSTFAVSILDGLGGAGGTVTQKDVTYLSANATLKTPVKGLTFGAAWDEVFFKNPDTQGYAYTLGGYIGFEATEKLKLSARGEYAKGSNGTWYTASINESDPSNELLGLTATVDYSLWGPNVITRAEFRLDHELTGQHAQGVGPFGNNDANALSVALNVIYKF